jgi:hypothetical protein
MLKYLLFIVLTAAAAWEFFVTGQFGIALVSGIYMALAVQAESAANRFLKYGLYPNGVPAYAFASQKASAQKAEAGAVLKTQPLGRTKNSSYEAPKQEKPKAKTQPSSQKPESKPASARAPEKASVKAPQVPRAPRFDGRPHEVLGVRENAATQTIVGAFRHWIKQYHPDHAHTPEQAKHANEHTRCLASARQNLLERRKQLRKNSRAA